MLPFMPPSGANTDPNAAVPFEGLGMGIIDLGQMDSLKNFFATAKANANRKAAYDKMFIAPRPAPEPMFGSRTVDDTVSAGSGEAGKSRSVTDLYSL